MEGLNTLRSFLHSDNVQKVVFAQDAFIGALSPSPPHTHTTPIAVTPAWGVAIGFVSWQ